MGLDFLSLQTIEQVEQWPRYGLIDEVAVGSAQAMSEKCVDLGRQPLAQMTVVLRSLAIQSVMRPEIRDLVISIVSFAIHDPLSRKKNGLPVSDIHAKRLSLPTVPCVWMTPD
jgi:hypothetical protein